MLAPRFPRPSSLPWLFVQEPSTLQKVEAEIISHVRQDVEVAHVYELARTFVDMVRQKKSELLDSWLESCRTSSVKAVRTFAAGIQQDYDAVRSALELL